MLTEKRIPYILILLFLSVFCTGLYSQNRKTEPQQKTPSRISPQDAYMQRMRYLLSRDPRTSDLTPAHVNSAINRIQNLFIKNDLPASIRDASSKTRVGATHLRMILQSLQKMIKHPDLEEVSGNRRTWFAQVAADLQTLAPALSEMDRAFSTQHNERYVKARKSYESALPKLEATLKKPIKVPSRELASMKTKNIQRRKIEIQREIQELNKKRRTQG